MSLDPALWTALERHGVHQEHLELLLQMLALQRNGHLSWHFVQGTLAQCDLRLTFPARSAEVHRVRDTVGTSACPH